MSGGPPRGTTPETYGKGSWDHQNVGHWSEDGYRSYLFQGQYTNHYVETVGNSQYNAEKRGGPTGLDADYDTFDIKMEFENVGRNTYEVTGWHRLWKSSALDEGCCWDWNYAGNAKDPAKRGYLEAFEGTWTADGGLDLSNVMPFLAIQNWGTIQPELHTFDWDSVVVTGTAASRAGHVDDVGRSWVPWARWPTGGGGSKATSTGVRRPTMFGAPPEHCIRHNDGPRWVWARGWFLCASLHGARRHHDTRGTCRRRRGLPPKNTAVRSARGGLASRSASRPVGNFGPGGTGVRPKGLRRDGPGAERESGHLLGGGQRQFARLSSQSLPRHLHQHGPGARLERQRHRRIQRPGDVAQQDGLRVGQPRGRSSTGHLRLRPTGGGGTAEDVWEATYWWFEDFAPGTSVLDGQVLASTSGWPCREVLQLTNPKLAFLWNAMVDAADVELGIAPTGAGDPHAVTLTGLAFDDLDGDGWWDGGEKPKEIGYLDPNQRLRADLVGRHDRPGSGADRISVVAECLLCLSRVHQGPRPGSRRRESRRRGR